MERYNVIAIYHFLCLPSVFSVTTVLFHLVTATASPRPQGEICDFAIIENGLRWNVIKLLSFARIPL